MDEIKEFLIYADGRLLAVEDTKSRALRAATRHNSQHPGEWAHVVEVKK